MSKYTTQLRWPVEQIEESATSVLSKGQQFHNETYAKLKLDDYPIFDEAYRPTLNDKIIRHFYFREIGQETMAQFTWYLRTRMFEIMPYYNQLYESTLIEFEPLTDTDMRYTDNWGIGRTGVENTTGNQKTQATQDTQGHADDVTDTESTETQSANTTTTSNDENVNDTSTTNHSRNVYSDTPMSLLGNTEAPTVEGLDYATNVTYDDGAGTTHGTASSRSNETSDSTQTLRSSTTSTRGQDTTGHVGTTGNVDTVGKVDKVDNEDGNRVRTEKGRRQSASDLLEKWRSTFLNIDVKVIGDLEYLFMGVW